LTYGSIFLQTPKLNFLFSKKSSNVFQLLRGGYDISLLLCRNVLTYCCKINVFKW